MAFTKIQNTDFKLVDDHFELSATYLQSNQARFKKITGSRLASVLDLNQYTSPARIWATMVNIYSDPMDPTLAKVGCVIEPKVHQYVSDQLKINFLQYNPAKIKWDVFADNRYFGGIPDGEPIDDQGAFLYPQCPMLEIKTTSIDSFVYKKKNNQMFLQFDGDLPKIKAKGERYQKWFDVEGNIIIPDEYKFQLGLYCYLRKVQKGLFAICFLKAEDYAHPELCDVNQREIRLVNFEVDNLMFKKITEQAQAWYEKYILTGISPKFNKNDWDWYNNEPK